MDDDTPTEIGPATTELNAAIEAVLMAATEPVEVGDLAQLLEIPITRVESLCAALAADYDREGRGFVLVRVAGGYRYQTHPEQAPYVERFVLEGQSARLSGPALETLAIVAYKQPVSRAQLSAIRGVNVDATLRTLVQRGYVEEIGHEPTLGSPALFGTSRMFLEKLGVDSLADLPPLADFMPDAHIVEVLERGLHVREPEANEVLADEVLADEVLADEVLADEVPTAEVPTAEVLVDESAPGPTTEEIRATVAVEKVAVEMIGVADAEPVASDLAAGVEAPE